MPSSTNGGNGAQQQYYQEQVPLKYKQNKRTKRKLIREPGKRLTATLNEGQGLSGTFLQPGNIIRAAHTLT